MRNTKLVVSCVFALLLYNHVEVFAGQAIKLQRPTGYIGAPIYPRVVKPEKGECEESGFGRLKDAGRLRDRILEYTIPGLPAGNKNIEEIKSTFRIYPASPDGDNLKERIINAGWDGLDIGSRAHENKLRLCLGSSAYRIPPRLGTDYSDDFKNLYLWYNVDVVISYLSINWYYIFFEDNFEDEFGVVGSGSIAPIIDSPDPGLPDFVTDKVIMANKSGKKEKYVWAINETAYVHSWTDNIGDADWEGDAEKIKVAFFLSKGKKEDRHSEWERVGREQIKKKNLKVKKKPKHEKIKFDLAKWANESKVLPGRTYNFVVCADRPKDEGNKDGDVKEKHKSNNCSTEAVFYVDFGPACNVDLITRNLVLTHGLTELQAGQKYGLQVEVSNIGTEQPWNGFRTSYQIKGPSTGGQWQYVDDDGSKASDLYPGATQFEYITDGGMVEAPMVGGDYTFRACADYEQVVPESDEGNNCTELEVYIVPPPMPDLITHSLRLTHGRTSLTVGDLYGLEVGIKNIGEVTPDNDFRSSYQIKGPGTLGAWQYVDDDGSHAEEVPPGATQWEHITDGHGAHIPDIPGTYTARACADYQGNVAEEDEGNNCSEMTFEVKPEPACVILNPLEDLPTTGSFDLAATSIEFPDTISQGDEMHPRAELCGVSGTSPQTRAMWAYANCDGTGFTHFDGDTDGGKSAGECITEENIKGDDVANMAPGRYVMYFIANGETKVPESDYSNNVSAKVFVVE